MSNYYLGQITPFGFMFAPRGWAICAGQILPINQNQALFSLLGTTYGGNGTITFALPDLRGRTPVSIGSLWGGGQYTLGQQSGVETVTLNQTQIPQHHHSATGTVANGTVRNPNNAIYAKTSVALHGPGTGPMVPLNTNTVATGGGSQPHSNLQPYLAINFCIALQGVFPSRN